ncbi:hypothetical protein Bbelb_026460 [Branchiostoma belcheri]|nr:hypothetical protein Bbelb_026460 [Branchiostoma belcheri]
MAGQQRSAPPPTGHKINGMAGLEPRTSRVSNTLPLDHTTPLLRHTANGVTSQTSFLTCIDVVVVTRPATLQARNLTAFSSQEPARDLTAARPNCKSRSAPYHTPHGSRRATDRSPNGTAHARRMKPAGVYAEDMPNGRRFKCDLSITTPPQ